MKLPVCMKSTRPLELVLVLIIIAAGAPSWARNRNAYPLPEERGTAGILAALEKLPVFVRVLHTMAHPDDESAGTLTWLARKAHARTALFSLTRGGGGQNILGNEKYEAMGLVRTGELLEACKIYGVEPYFSTVFEFGFSKSAEETLSKWGHETSLEEIVRFIRMWRPSIIISRFQGTPQDGHGHHQAAGLLTLEAFRAAGDPRKFPEHFRQGLTSWQSKKLYRSVRGRRTLGPQHRQDESPPEDDWTVRVNVGAHDPVLGRSYREIGTEGYSKHRSQGNGGRFSPAGPAFDYYKLVDSIVEIKDKEESFFSSIDITLNAILELAGSEVAQLPFLEKDLSGAIGAATTAFQAFRPHQPEASAVETAKGVTILAESIRQVESSNLTVATKRIVQDALQEKKLDFENATNASLGIYLVAIPAEPTAVPGKKMPVTVYFFNRGSQVVGLKRVTLLMPEGWVSSLPPEPPLGEVASGNVARFDFTVEVSQQARVTEPFWYRESKQDDRYKTRPTANVFAPFCRPEIVARAVYRYKNNELSINATARAQVSDPIRGVEFVDFQIVPSISVTVNPKFVVAPLSLIAQTREFQVSLLNSQDAVAHGSLRIKSPRGWRVEPESIPFSISRRLGSYHSKFSLQIPAGTGEGTYAIKAVATMEGREYQRGFQVISYPENWTRRLYFDSRAEVKIFRVEVLPDLTIGYVRGSGDEVPSALEQLGVKVRFLTDEILSFGDLSVYSAIVTGVRAYNVNKALRANNQRLLKYVEQGGVLILQYNRPFDEPSSPFPYGPYPMTLTSRDRITVEESPLKILEPQHSIFTTPNHITQKDFSGWVQERGLNFMNEWDGRYTPLLSGNDPGEDPQKGGMLVARFGKGYYVYTAYAWFRQLPAGVPGAFRIFANLISLGP